MKSTTYPREYTMSAFLAIPTMSVYEAIFALVVLLCITRLFSYRGFESLLSPHYGPDPSVFGDGPVTPTADLTVDDEGRLESRDLRRTNYRAFILRKLRESCHIDDYPNNPLNRRVLKRKVVNIMRKSTEDIRDFDLYSHADIIVELFFIPTKIDMEVRALRNDPRVLERLELYQGQSTWSSRFQRWLFPSRGGSANNSLQ